MKVLIITMHEDTALLREALVAGASGYLIKRAADAELIAAIQAVMRGELYVHPALTRHLLQGLTAPPAMKEAEPLSPREIEVLRLLAAGYTNRQIAEMLSLSVRTVESHRATISEKLNLRTRADLAQYASEHGLLRPGK